ncbi:MAG: phosphoribosylanthranilate isomerase [Marinirhabdus sp.]|nr:phosphoribosylanthranilate isomerase [Marinirhabdus sp.]
MVTTKNIAIKVCGMKHNTAEVAQLQPDYLGFIFYGESPRCYVDIIPALPKGIKKVGVFVNASVVQILEKLKIYSLDVIQLHGDESVAYISALRKHLPPSVSIWKVFGIKDTFDFKKIAPFNAVVDALLFDTKGKHRGGNGTPFNWEVLQGYPFETPVILSGGIGLEHIEAIQQVMATNLPFLAIDVNSKFERRPGLKDPKQLKQFIEAIQHINTHEK